MDQQGVERGRGSENSTFKVEVGEPGKKNTENSVFSEEKITVVYHIFQAVKKDHEWDSVY